jgi:HPt (histidine-containing phosphotransfer) domain-containing protein
MVRSTSQYDENLDRASILKRLDGNQELLTELIQLFSGEAPQLIKGMRIALQRGDMQELERSAHSMKGAASNFSAYGTVSAASQLESDAKNGDSESAKASLAALEVVVERLLPELASLCQGSPK